MSASLLPHCSGRISGGRVVRLAITRHAVDECSGGLLARDMGRSRYFKCRVCRLWICGACEGGDDSPLKDNGPVCDPCWCAVTTAKELLMSLPADHYIYELRATTNCPRGDA